MTQDEIIAGNCEIADMMGIPTIRTAGNELLYNIEKYNPSLLKTIPVNNFMGLGVVETKLLLYSGTQLQFHSDLNWLAEAVRKFCEVDTSHMTGTALQTLYELYYEKLRNVKLMPERIEAFELLVSACQFLKENQK